MKLHLNVSRLILGSIVHTNKVFLGLKQIQQAYSQSCSWILYSLIKMCDILYVYLYFSMLFSNDIAYTLQ